MAAPLWIWIAAGAACGGAQAFALWRRAHGWRDQPLAGAWRLPLVAGFLVAAALAGLLLPATLGWACGLVAASALLIARSRT
jgi:hypothetical protein